jgi:hypothetical protein
MEPARQLNIDVPDVPFDDHRTNGGKRGHHLGPRPAATLRRVGACHRACAELDANGVRTSSPVARIQKRGKMLPHRVSHGSLAKESDPWLARAIQPCQEVWVVAQAGYKGRLQEARVSRPRSQLLTIYRNSVSALAIMRASRRPQRVNQQQSLIREAGLTRASAESKLFR